MVEIVDAPVVWVGDTPHDAAVVQRAIFSALIAKGWKGQQIQPGLIHATLTRDDWTAEIDIPYSESAYSLKYSNSIKLDYDAQKHVIHRNFNKWLVNLRELIDAETGRPDVR